MGLNKTTYFLMGIKCDNEKELNKMGVDDWWDERWQPYIEGRPDFVPYILTRGESTPEVFFGYLIASSGYGNSENKPPQSIELPDRQEVVDKLREIGLQFQDEDVKLWFFEQYL